jgi:outer membrane protein assembly factor BamB
MERQGYLPVFRAAFVTILFAALAAACSLQPSEEEEAMGILADTGVRGGLIVHVGCGDGKLTRALGAGNSYLVHGLDPDMENVQKARNHIQSVREYGKVSVERIVGDRLPYVDNLVNLVVAEDLGKISMDEVMRVLCPEGVACIKKGNQWKKTRKPRPLEIDEWTHYLHDPSNNAVAHDDAIGPPRRLQWVGSPRWSRHHDRMASMSALVSSGGRIFYIVDEGPISSILLPSEWSLIARDAFNGSVLWKKSIETWHPRLYPFKSGPAYLPRRLVAVGDKVYVTLGLSAPVTALDAATGEAIQTYEGTFATDEIIVSDGVLFLTLDESPRDFKDYKPVHENVGIERNRLMKEYFWNREGRKLVAVQAKSGEILWNAEHPAVPLTLAVDGQSVYFHDGERIVCLDRTSGKEKWSSIPIERRELIPTNIVPTLVVYKDVVLFSGCVRKMTAISAETGDVLWTSDYPPAGHYSAEDIFVTDELVWAGATAGSKDSGVFTGRNLHTGEIVSQFGPTVETYWFHQRCYRAKATDNYLLPSRTGIEFVDFRAKNWEIHHWVRGGCIYGIMPCNGLIYAPMNACACYPEAKLYGFNALAPELASRPELEELSEKERLFPGPIYDEPMEVRSEISDQAEWSTYRHDSARSGFTKSSVPAELEPAWEAELGGKLSSTVISENRVYVADVDAHTVNALDAEAGDVLWSFTAGGRVDSPPTVYQGRVFFGSADGFVYCLRATDGELAWRFRAAPIDQRLMAFEQLESVWPVHGSVLIQNGALYCVSGRSMFLDGGMRLLKLNPKTGQKMSERILNDRDPDTGENIQVRVRTLNMPVALPDILSSDGKSIYMRSQQFDLDGNRLYLGPHSGVPVEQGSVQTGESSHLFSPTGFLDDTWWHRSYWVYGQSFAGGHSGWYQAGRFAPSGRILVFDDTTVYGFGRKPMYFRWRTPLEYHLFAADKQAQIVEDSPVPHEGGAGMGEIRPQHTEYDWSKAVKLQARAMLLADKVLFIAGPPDLLDEEELYSQMGEEGLKGYRELEDQSAALKGEQGALLWAVSAEHGKILAEYPLGSLPVFDGMSAAGGKLYLSLMNGTVVCMGR